jgi:hypothetical protein
MNRELEENLNNSYLVKRRLATLKKLPGDRCFHLKIGDFHIRLYANADYSNPPNIELPRVTDYKNVTFELWEDYNHLDPNTNLIVKGRLKIELYSDYRFALFYEELKYTKEDFNWRQGRLMPIPIVCDLIKHIDRINELVAFH